MKHRNQNVQRASHLILQFGGQNIFKMFRIDFVLVQVLLRGFILWGVLSLQPVRTVLNCSSFLNSCYQKKMLSASVLGKELNAKFMCKSEMWAISLKPLPLFFSTDM